MCELRCEAEEERERYEEVEEGKESIETSKYKNVVNERISGRILLQRSLQ